MGSNCSRVNEEILVGKTIIHMVYYPGYIGSGIDPEDFPHLVTIKCSDNTSYEVVREYDRDKVKFYTEKDLIEDDYKAFVNLKRNSYNMTEKFNLPMTVEKVTRTSGWLRIENDEKYIMMPISHMEVESMKYVSGPDSSDVTLGM